MRGMWLSVALSALVGCGASQGAATEPIGALARGPSVPPEVRAAARAPVARTPFQRSRITGATFNGGRVTPYGVSGAEPRMTLTELSRDPTYGYSQENPIRVGGLGEREQAAFFNALFGPEGQIVSWGRIGSCCMEVGPVLDRFAVTYEGLGDRFVVLHVDIYNVDPPRVPVGFTSPGAR